MKADQRPLRNPSVRLKVPNDRRRSYWTVIALASMACGGVAKAQTLTNTPLLTNIPPVTNIPILTNLPLLTNIPVFTNVPIVTNVPVMTNVPALVVPPSSSSTNVTELQETTVSATVEQPGSQIVPELGTSAYTIGAPQIQTIPGGDNAQLNQVLLRAPGVAQDSAVNGGIHVRGEHGNLQYRINDVFLPEGISGFGLAVDARFVDSMQLITGALPAQYGYRTAGIVDIRTKSGAYENGGNGEIYFGSHDTVQPSFQYGGSTSNVNYYVSGSFLHDSLGIENPVPTHEAIHDNTDQEKFFSYTSYKLDATSQLSLMLSAANSDYQVPNVPGNQGPGPFFGTNAVPAGLPATFNSANLNENQNEQNYFGALTYQKSDGPLNYQVSALARRSSVHFMPDQTGDLFFFGEASDVDRILDGGGLQADFTYTLNENHTLRGGLLFIGETVADDTTTTVYQTGTNGIATGSPFPIVNNSQPSSFFTGFYAQDQWKVFEKLTLNYGARFDIFNSSFDNENQFSPRANLVYTPWEKTTFHAGYARYFTPPPIESVPASQVTQFANTTGAPATFQDDPVKCERANYFDVGVSQEVGKGLTLGVDAYYKQAKNQLDDGLFGQTLILSAFNYADGITEGVEMTANYTKGGFTAYANLAIGTALGTTITSSQFLFTPDQLNFINAGNYIHLDHLQTVSGSFGVSYLWQQSKNCTLQTFADAIYGSGLRTDLDLLGASGNVTSTIPNGGTLPGYYSLNIGAEQRFKLSGKKYLKARIDIVNLTDTSYALRNGFGVGVGAPQFGERRSFYGTIGFQF